MIERLILIHVVFQVKVGLDLKNDHLRALQAFVKVLPDSRGSRDTIFGLGILSRGSKGDWSSKMTLLKLPVSFLSSYPVVLLYKVLDLAFVYFHIGFKGGFKLENDVFRALQAFVNVLPDNQGSLEGTRGTIFV